MLNGWRYAKDGHLAQDVDLIQTQVDNLIVLTDNSRRQKPEQLSAERKRHRGVYVPI
jgi:hypothetical protein